MFVHSRNFSNNFRISSAGDGQQKLKKLNMAAEGAKQGSLLFFTQNFKGGKP